MTSRWTHVLFDMDGTLLESGDAIMGRIARTLMEFGVVVPDRNELRLLLGPPTHETLGRYLQPIQLTEATAFYRGLAEADGMTGMRLFAGMQDLLHELAERGIPVATATSKLRVEAARVVNHFEIGQLFAAVQGAEPERGVYTKGDVVAAALADLGVTAQDTPVMVGDRIHDIHGAARCGVPTIVCSWGYADESEFSAAYQRIDTVDELRSELIR
ncbi:MAG: HAD hydrolase-like protein [Microbacteriaceae bacterium]